MLHDGRLVMIASHRSLEDLWKTCLSTEDLPLHPFLNLDGQMAHLRKGEIYRHPGLFVPTLLRAMQVPILPGTKRCPQKSLRNDGDLSWKRAPQNNLNVAWAAKLKYAASPRLVVLRRLVHRQSRSLQGGDPRKYQIERKQRLRLVFSLYSRHYPHNNRHHLLHRHFHSCPSRLFQ